MRHVALLRGINVGGNNIIPMAKLKACFETAGYDDVSTYIASGNVLFSSPTRLAKTLEAPIEKALSATFGYDAKVVVRSKTEVQKTIDQAPPDWPRSGLRCYVLFVKAPLTPAKTLKESPPRAGVDTATPGPGVVYYGTKMTERTRSGLQKLLSLPIYKSMTIRNYATVTKILDRL